MVNRLQPIVLLNLVGCLYGRILTEVASTDGTQWGLYQQPRSRFSHTDLPSSVNKMFIILLLYGQTRNQKDKKINNFICSPARAEVFSWLTSVTSLQSKWDKNKCSKSSFVQTLSMNEDKITALFIQAQWKISKKWPKLQQILMPVCGSIAQRSVLIQPCDLPLIPTKNIVLLCSGKNWPRLDLLDCEEPTWTWRTYECWSDFLFHGGGVRWKPLNVHGSYLEPFCLQTEMKNLDKRRSSTLAGMFSIYCSRLFQWHPKFLPCI